MTTLDMEVVCDLVLREIGPGSSALSTLGGGGSTVCVTLDLVHHTCFNLVDGTLVADGDALGVGMNTPGSEAWG